MKETCNNTCSLKIAERNMACSVHKRKENKQTKIQTENKERKNRRNKVRKSAEKNGMLYTHKKEKISKRKSRLKRKKARMGGTKLGKLQKVTWQKKGKQTNKNPD